MTTKKKIAISGVVLAALVFIAYRWYAYRWINFSDNVFGGAIIPNNDNNQAQYSGMVGFLLNSSHNLKPGDTIEVEQAGGYKYAQYNGEAIVKRVEADGIITHKGFAGNSPVNPGRVRLVKKG